MITEFSLADYAISVGDISIAFPMWFDERGYQQVFLVTDENILHDCIPLFLEKSGLTADLLAGTAAIPPGEEHKTLATCEKVWNAMLHARLTRHSLVINLGGGVVGDLGGFCAATWKRGLDFVQVPTTLLSMTDASVGGKLGIDFQGIKNTIGVFRNPAAVFVDPDFLKTLPERELRSGMAEVVKHALIGSPMLMEQLSDTRMLSESLDAPERYLSWWHRLLCDSIAVKARIVADDPHEQGLRMLLNYGHTVGHAIESYFLKTPFPLTHGEAIAIGMICESWLARTVVPDGHNQLARVIGTVSDVFLHHPVPESAYEEIWAAMQQDKKNTTDAVRCAVPTGESFGMEILEVTEAAITESLNFYNELA